MSKKIGVKKINVFLVFREISATAHMKWNNKPVARVHTTEVGTSQRMKCVF
jgi:hypothetical protein